LIELYRQHMQARHLAPVSIDHRVMHIEHFLGWVGKSTRASHPDIRDITFQQLQDFYEYRGRQRNQQGEPLTLGYRQAEIHAVINFYAFLKARGKIILNPFAEFPVMRKPHRLPKGVIANAQVLRWMAQPDVHTPLGYRDRTMMEVLYSCGLRGIEVCNLAIYDVDLKERTVRVNQGKGKKDRVVPIGKVAAEYVAEYLERVRPIILASNRSRAAAMLASGLGVERMFLSNHGTAMRTQVLRRILMRYSSTARLPRSVTVHSLRHACATEMLRGGASVRHVQELLGHAHLTTTQIYTRVVPSDLKRVHKNTSPSERRKVIDVPAFELHGWRDKNSPRRRKH
jgi:integrase/recombinase XerD